MTERPSWDRTWMLVAEAIGDRSPCVMRQVGAVIVSRQNRIVATGYNGPPALFPTKDVCDTYCPRAMTGEQTQSYGNCVSVHAEANALIYSDRHLYEKGTLYVTSMLCWDCGKLVANSGIRRVVTRIDWARDGHRNPDATLQFMRDCGITVEVHDE